MPVLSFYLDCNIRSRNWRYWTAAQDRDRAWSER